MKYNKELKVIAVLIILLLMLLGGAKFFSTDINSISNQPTNVTPTTDNPNVIKHEALFDVGDIQGAWKYIDDGTASTSGRNQLSGLEGYRNSTLVMNFIIDPITEQKIFATYLNDKPYIYACGWQLKDDKVNIICEGTAEPEFNIVSITKPDSQNPDEPRLMTITWTNGLQDKFYSTNSIWKNYTDQKGEASKYSTDGKIVYYYNSMPVFGADPKSFEYISRTEGSTNAKFDGFGRDSKNVYINGQVVRDADVKTFKIAKGGLYVLDKNHAYTYQDLTKSFEKDDNNPCLGITDCRE
jgi:hypothetical protein